MNVFIYNNPQFIKQKIHQFTRSIWIPKTSETKYILEEIHKILQSKNTNTTFYVEDSLIKEEVHFDFELVRSNEIVPLANDNQKIVFYSQSDTLSSSLIPIIKHLGAKDYIVFIPPIDAEHAARPLQLHDIEFSTLSSHQFLATKPSLLFLLNDWSKIARGLLALARMKGIASICLQESIISFGDSQKRMERSDYVMIQGLKTLKHLEHKNAFLTGNPRYKPAPSETTKDAFILVNCNFTYNVEEDNRNLWLDQVVAALEQQDYKYKIVQHPRDKGDLSNYKNVFSSSSSSINEYLGTCIGLVSRFSSLLHEAIVNQVPAIYFNPHGEQLRYDFEPDDKVMFYCTSKTDLASTLQRLKTQEPHTASFRRYLINHCYNPEVDTPSKIAELIKNVQFNPGEVSLGDQIDARLYTPEIRKTIDFLKKKLPS